jgi:hypothetical protein
MSIPSNSEEFHERTKWRTKTKDHKLSVSNCIAAWSDICGFGEQLRKNKWNLESLQKDGMLLLLSEVFTAVGGPLLVNISPLPHEIVLVLNDGVARTVDMLHKDKVSSQTFLFYLRDLLFTHYFLLEITRKYDLGVRTIVAGGEKVQYSPTTQTGESILFYDDAKISDFGKKFLNTTFLYNPAEFQMNTAFAKAFTIDSIGTKGNILVNGFYIEDSFLEKIADLKDILIKKQKKSIEFVLKGTLVFKFILAESFERDIKGLKVLLHHVKSFEIYKDFDGDDVVVKMFR